MHLKVLHFENESFTDEAFKYLPHLESLTLTLKYKNRIKEEGFKYLVNLTSITLNHYCKDGCGCITASIFSVLSKLTSIRLYCYNYMIHTHFSIFPELDYLDMSGLDSVPYEKHLFSKLKVKYMSLYTSFISIRRKNIKDLIKNGTKTISIIKE